MEQFEKDLRELVEKYLRDDLDKERYIEGVMLEIDEHCHSYEIRASHTNNGVPVVVG